MQASRLLLSAGILACLAAGTLALTSAASSPSAPAPALAPGKWQVDTTHSSALFKVKHYGAAWFYGRFNGITGSIEYDPQDVSASSVLIKIDTGTIDTKTKGLDDHLKSPDFFDAAQFPELSFESQSVKAGKEKDTLQVQGQLSLHGVTRPLTAVVSLVGTGEGRGGSKVAGFHTSFTIDRTDFGMSYGVPTAIGKDVEIVISIEAVQR